MPEEPEEVVILLVVEQQRQQLVEVVQQVVDVQQEGSPRDVGVQGVVGARAPPSSSGKYQARSPPGSPESAKPDCVQVDKECRARSPPDSPRSAKPDDVQVFQDVARSSSRLVVQGVVDRQDQKFVVQCYGVGETKTGQLEPRGLRYQIPLGSRFHTFGP